MSPLVASLPLTCSKELEKCFVALACGNIIFGQDPAKKEQADCSQLTIFINYKIKLHQTFDVLGSLLSRSCGS